MKYIIELKDDVQVVQKVGVTENGNAFVMNFYKDQLEELTTDYINEHYGSLQDEAYKRGINDGSLDVKQRVEGAYQRGLDDAWECGKKLAWTAKYGGYGERLNDVFGRDDTFDFYDYTPNEAIEKLKAFEQKQDKIKVGDEVAFHHDDGRPDTVVVVTYIGQDGFIDGMDGRGTQYAHKNPIKWTKTGRHFDIASILEEMKHD